MRPGALRRTVAGVTEISTPDGDAVRLVLDVQRGSEPITGRLFRADGGISQFTGWVELTRVLEEACRAAADDDAAAPDTIA
jgi:hypothetical protein